MSKRTLIVVMLAGALVLASGGIALAKGPESATITGPGIDEPIELIATGNPDLVRELMGQTGLWYATGGGSRLPARPEGQLGPAYTLTWVKADLSSYPIEKRTIIQLLYLQAENGPVIHTPAQEGLEGWGPEVVGWSNAPDGLAETLNALGTPSLAAQSDLDSSGADKAPAAASAHSGFVDRIGYLAAVSVSLLIVLIWAARRRSTII